MTRIKIKSNNFGTIYQIYNLKENKRYIGQTIKARPLERWTSHKSDLRSNRNRNRKLQNAWNSSNENDWVFSIIEYAEDQYQLDFLEIYWIITLDTTNSGYNIRLGPKGKGVTNEETKLKLSKKAKRRYKDPIERFKCGNTKRGVPKTEEHKSKISATLTGRKIPRNIVNRCSRKTKNTWKSRTVAEKRKILKLSHDRMREYYTKIALEKYPPLISPLGEIVKIDCPLAIFARKNNLLKNKLSVIFREPFRHHKGWRVYI